MKGIKINRYFYMYKVINEIRLFLPNNKFYICNLREETHTISKRENVFNYYLYH